MGKQANMFLRLMSQNVRSLSSDKEEELINKMREKSIYATCVQETWKHQTQPYLIHQCAVITNGPAASTAPKGRGVAVILGEQATKAWRESGTDANASLGVRPEDQRGIDMEDYSNGLAM